MCLLHPPFFLRGRGEGGCRNPILACNSSCVSSGLLRSEQNRSLSVSLYRPSIAPSGDDNAIWMDAAIHEWRIFSGGDRARPDTLARGGGRGEAAERAGPSVTVSSQGCMALGARGSGKRSRVFLLRRLLPVRRISGVVGLAEYLDNRASHDLVRFYDPVRWVQIYPVYALVVVFLAKYLSGWLPEILNYLGMCICC